MASFFRMWQFGSDDTLRHSEFRKFTDGDAAMEFARKRFPSLERVEVWDGCCRIWPRLAKPKRRPGKKHQEQHSVDAVM